MTNGQIIRKLLTSTGFYWRQFFVFLLFAAAIGIGFLVWQNQNKTEAAFQLTEDVVTSSIEQVKINIQITAHGRITTDDHKDLSRYLKILPDAYEISLPATDMLGVYIDNLQVVMHLPQAVRPDQIRQRIIAIHGAEDSYRSYMLDRQTLVYEVNAVPPQGSVTVIADLPKDILDPSLDKKLVYFFSQIPAKSYIVLSIVLPLVTLIILIFMIARRRQDQFFYVSRKIITAPPFDSAPAVVGALMDGQLGAREIAATIIDLAVRGYLFITYHQDGIFSFGKRKSLDLENLPELREFERVLLSKIFEPDHYKSTREDVEMRVGRHIFSRKIAQVYLNIYNEATRDGFFVKNPAVVHLWWKYTGIILFFIGLASFILAAFFAPDPKFTLFFWVGEIGVASVIIRLSGLMPVRSVTGTTALRQWLEFGHYLSLAKPIEAGTNIMDKFCQLLPYAIVFGKESEWTRRFMKENFNKPDWYESDEQVVTLDRFVAGLFPIIDYVGGALHRSHEPTVE